MFRRTDYKHHYKKLYHGKLVDHHHFDKAFQVYRFVYTIHQYCYIDESQKKLENLIGLSLFFIRSRYNNNSNKIVFLALSDDYNWIKVTDDTKKPHKSTQTFRQILQSTPI